MRLPSGSTLEAGDSSTLPDATVGEQQPLPQPPSAPFSSVPASNGVMKQRQGAASQDSLDDYYDASGTLGRGRGPGCGPSIVRPRPLSRERRRHASSGATFTENGHSSRALVENGVGGDHPGKDNYTSSPCVYNKGPIARVRHASFCDSISVGSNSPALQSKYSTPYQSAHFTLPHRDGSTLHLGGGSVAAGSVPRLAGMTGEVSAASCDRHIDLVTGIERRAAVSTTNGSLNGHLGLARDNGSTSLGNVSDSVVRNGCTSSIEQRRITHGFNGDTGTGLQHQPNGVHFNSTNFSGHNGLNTDVMPCSSSAVNGDCALRDDSSVLVSGVKDKVAVDDSRARNSKRYDPPTRGHSNADSPITTNYVPCVDVERDPAFSKNPESDESPRKNVTYSEFTLDKAQMVKPMNKIQARSLLDRAASSSLSGSQPQSSTATPDHAAAGSRSHRSKSSSCMSLNFNWKRNYVPFQDLDRAIGVTSDSIVVAGLAEEPLLQECSPTQPDAQLPGEEKVVTMYSFDKASAGGGAWRWREEWALGNMRLTHPVPHLFVTAQWQQHNRMSCLYLGYRLFWALYFSMWAGWSLAGNMGYGAPWRLKVHYFTYLTNWSIWLLAVDTVLQAANVLQHMRRLAEHGDARYPVMPKSFRISWVLSNITFSAHIFVTIAYWATVYPFRADEELSIIGINTHLVPGLYMLLDSHTSAMPRRLLHALHPTLYFLAYLMFSMLYFLLGGKDYLGRVALYPLLDWSLPGRSVLVATGMLVLVVPLLHSLLCCIYAFRVWIWRRYRLARYICEDGDMEKSSRFEEQIV